jgi:arylsulfatase A-like enzyme
MHVYNEQLRVPLILHEGGRNAGVRVRELARHVDVLPSLAERLGIRLDQNGFTAPGRSLLPLVAGGAAAPAPPPMLFAVRRPVDDRQRRHWEKGEVYSIQDLDWKYVVHTEGKDEFFDLRSDPLELRNLLEAPSPVKDRLGQIAREAWASLSSEGASVRPTPFDPRMREELRALGYVN